MENSRRLKKQMFEETFSLLTLLPEKAQKEAIDYIYYLIFKNKGVSKSKIKTDDPYSLSPEDRAELRRRIKNAEEHPETLLSGEEVINRLEAKLGKKISIRSGSRKRA